MSFSFYVKTSTPPRWSALVDAVAEPLWECTEDPPEDDRFVSGLVRHPYARGRAARGVEVAFEGDALQVRILTCSSKGDYELGLRTILAMARLCEANIEPEDGDAMSPAALGDRY